MPFVPVPDTLLVEVVFEVDLQVCENTMYFRKTTPWEESDIVTFLTDLKDIVGSVLLPLLSTTVKFVKLVGTLLDAVDALSVVLNISPPQSGTDISTTLPNNVSYVITFLTSGRGRSNRGRNYIVGLTTADTLGPNQIAAATRTGLLSYYNQVLSLGGDSGIEMVVASRFSGVDSSGNPIPRVVGVTRPITGFTTSDLTLDSQRRRLPGRGK